MDYGFVYCLINESMPGLCKVGCVLTANKTSQERAKDLSSSTSCPTAFKVVYDIKVINPMKYERRIHDKIKSFRKNKNREFFYCDPEDIVQYFKMENLILSENEKINFCENYFQRYINNENKNIIDNSNKNIEDDNNIIAKEKIHELEIKNKIKHILNNNVLTKYIIIKDTDINKEPLEKINNNCNELNDNKSEYNTEVERTNDNKIFICDTCKKVFKYNSQLVRHNNSKTKCNGNRENTIEKELKTINNKIYNCTKKSIDNMCGFCNKNYYNKSNLRRHINEHCDIRKDLIEKRTKLTDMKKNNNDKIKKITNQLTSILQVH